MIMPQVLYQMLRRLFNKSFGVGSRVRKIKKINLNITEDIEYSEDKKTSSYEEDIKVLSKSRVSRLKSTDFTPFEFHEDLLIFRFFSKKNSLILNVGYDIFTPRHIWLAGSESKIVSLIPYLSEHTKVEELAEENEDRFEYRVVSPGEDGGPPNHVYLVPVVKNRILYSLAYRRDSLGSKPIHEVLEKEAGSVFLSNGIRGPRFVDIVTEKDSIDNLMEGGIANFVWRKLVVIYFGLNCGAVEMISGSVNTIRMHQPLIIVRRQFEGIGTLVDEIMQSLLYIKATQRNSVLYPCDDVVSGEHNFYVPECRISEFRKLGLYSE